MRAKSACFCLVLAAGLAHGQPLAITFRNVVALPDTSVDQNGQSFPIAGLSGIYCSTAVNLSSNTLWAVMDNSNKIVRFSVTVAPDATVTSTTMHSGITLAEARDFEGIANFGGGFAFLAEEGTPAIRSYFLNTGGTGMPLETPTVYANIRPNFGFESLTHEQFGFRLWTANEEALTVDGPVSSSTAGTVVRLLRYDLIGNQFTPAAQFACVTEPWHGTAISGARSGVSDLLSLPDGRMLLLERSFAFNLGGFFQTRIYELDFTGATDVSMFPGLIGQNYTPITKRLLYQGDQQNLGGLTLGPHVGNGRYSLIGIVDDGDPISVNRLVAFELSGVGGSLCYVNCDRSNGIPILSANDFMCFLNRFAAGDRYANCDGSTTPPVLSANDFQCFLNTFAGYCE